MYWHLLSLKGLKKKACNEKSKKKREERIVKVIINNIACAQVKRHACAQEKGMCSDPQVTMGTHAYTRAPRVAGRTQ